MKFKSQAEEYLDIEIAQNWNRLKVQSDLLANIYYSFNKSKAFRLKNCCTNLRFALGDKVRLIYAEFCKVRLCPLCQWRRQYKHWLHAVEVVSHLVVSGQYNFVILTLSRECVSGEDLADEIKDLGCIWRNFVRHKVFSRAVRGCIKSIEVTHNVSKDWYHPHFHVLLVVDKDYFINPQKYMRWEFLLKSWKKVCSSDSDLALHIQSVDKKAPLSKSVGEVVKYSLKPAQYIIPKNPTLSRQIVLTLDYSLSNRRFIEFTGICRSILKTLKIDSEEYLDIQACAIEQASEIVSYVWQGGFYKRID